MAMRTARVPAQFCAMATVLLVGRVQAQTNCLNFACPAGQSRVANPSAVTCANEAGGTCTSVTCCAYQCNSYGCGTGYTNYGSGLQCPSAYYGGCSRNYCCRSTAETTGGTTGGTTDGTTGGTTGDTTGGTTDGTTDGTTGGITDGTTGGGTAAAAAAGTCETYTCATTGTTKVGNPAAVACSINTNGGICDDNLCCAFQCASYPCANGAENWGAALQCRSKFHGGCSQEFCCKALSVDTTTIASTTTAATTAAPTTTNGGNDIAPIGGTTTNGGNNIAPDDGDTGGGGVIIAGGVESMPGNAVQAVAYGEALSGLWSATKHVPQLTPSLMAGFAVATVGAAAAAATAGLVVQRQTGQPQDAEPLVEQLEADGQ